ncbi:MAG: DUF4331 domain-containing protein [Candidatus Eremiobacteraeota bacterium]|nr:DUF4331 domain-containing protein [Candidatus Eremiobacteraeota bacterium]
MKRILTTTLAGLVIVALGLTFLLYGNLRARSSDHQDSPLTVGRPGADITDVFLFPAADPNKVVLAMDIHPLIPRGQANTAFFDPQVMYQFKIDTANNFHEDKVIQFKAVGEGADQQLQMYGPTAPAEVGTKSTWVGDPQTFAFNKPTQLANGVTVFAGPRKDPFYIDLSQFFKILPDRDYKNHPNVPPPSATCFRPPGQAQDFLKDYNVLSFVVELPRAMLAGPDGRVGLIHLYTTTSLQENGSSDYTQVERLARPAVKEAFEPFDRHDTTNRSSPWADPYLGADILSFMTGTAGRSDQLAKAVEQTLIPDEMTADLSAFGPARYLGVETHGKSGLPIAVIRLVPTFQLGGLKKAIGDPYRYFGGRDPSSPVIDLSLGVIFGSLGQKVGLAADDGKETSCLTADNVVAGDRGVTNTFPYMGAPI